MDPGSSEENAMKCDICKTGETADGSTTVTIEQKGSVLVLRGVPARVCRTCGEAYVSSEVTDEILRRADDMQRQGIEVDVRRFAVARGVEQCGNCHEPPECGSSPVPRAVHPFPDAPRRGRAPALPLLTRRRIEHMLILNLLPVGSAHLGLRRNGVRHAAC